MKYLIGIAYVNRPDLLHRAVRSIEPYWPHTIIIDNSPEHELLQDPFLTANVKVVPSMVPLTFSQTMNFLQKKGEESNCDCILFMHNDAEAAPGTPEGLLAFLESLFDRGERWGMVFTHYDILVAMNMEAVRAAGRWDANLPQYYADNDYYRRLRLAGYPSFESELEVNHYPSSTLLADPYRQMVNRITFSLYERYYAAKWGGVPGEERYPVPFNLNPREGAL